MILPLMGDFRESLGRECMDRLEDYANNLPSTEFPCYIVICAKADRNQAGHINAAIQHYKERPPALVGILVWYADKDKGILDIVPELSLPPDVPLDPQHLSKDPKDSFKSIAEVGEKMGVLLS